MFQARPPNLTSIAQMLLYYRYQSVLLVSLGPGSVVGEKGQKGKKWGQIGKISASRAVAWGEGKATTLSSPQTTSQLASLVDFFSFFPNAEPGPRLTCSMVHEGHVPHMIPVAWPSHHQSSLS